MKRPAVFLDRDNTIIHNDGDLGDPDQVKLIQGAASAIASICGLGYKLVVVTNQGGVARGKYTEEDVDAVHDRIEAEVRERANGARIDAFYACPFHPQGTVARYKKEHPTRKPKPGMLLQAAEDLGLDLNQSWMIGDALRDIEAGAAAGCRTVLLHADWTDTSLGDLRKQEAAKAGKKSARGRKIVEPDFVAKGLIEAVRIIASQRKPEAAEQANRKHVTGKRWDAEAMSKLQQPRPSKPDELPPPSEASTAADTPTPSARPTTPPVSATPLAVPPPARPFVPWTKQSPPAPEVSAAEVRAPDVPDPEKRAPEMRPPEGLAPSASTATTAPESSSDTATHVNENPAMGVGSAPAAQVTDPTPGPAWTPPSPSSLHDSQDQHPDAEKTSEGAEQKLPEVGVRAGAGAGDAQEWAALNKTMRLVLQELRMQRGTSGEFHQLGVVAIVIQAVAFICLLGALWMGAGDGGAGAYLRWIGVAIVLQLAVIATLLFSKPSG